MFTCEKVQIGALWIHIPLSTLDPPMVLKSRKQRKKKKPMVRAVFRGGTRGISRNCRGGGEDGEGREKPWQLPRSWGEWETQISNSKDLTMSRCRKKKKKLFWGRRGKNGTMVNMPMVGIETLYIIALRSATNIFNFDELKYWKWTRFHHHWALHSS